MHGNLFKVYNKNKSERRCWHRFGVFRVIFEQIALIFFGVSIVHFEEANTGCKFTSAKYAYIYSSNFNFPEKWMLILFIQMPHFYTPWKRQKTKGFYVIGFQCSRFCWKTMLKLATDLCIIHIVYIFFWNKSFC